MESFGEEELRIAVRTELTSADCCWVVVAELRLVGEPSDMVGKVDGGNMLFILYVEIVLDNGDLILNSCAIISL
jgi:hypothetical protein